MMDAPAQQLPFRPRRVQNVALGKEKLPCAGPCSLRFATRRIRNATVGGKRLRPRAARFVVNRATRLPRQTHSRPKIRQLPQAPSQRNGDGIGGIQTEKPNARHIIALIDHIRAHIAFVKMRQPRHGRRPNGTHVPHRKGNQANIRRALERIDAQTGRQQFLQIVRRHDPMQKQKVMPFLPHYDAPVRPARRRDTVNLRHGCV